MYKGSQKKVIVLRGKQDSPFREAYLVMRDGSLGGKPMRDILREADKMLDENDMGTRFPRRAKEFFFFALGAAVSAAVFAAVLIFCL